MPHRSAAALVPPWATGADGPGPLLALRPRSAYRVTNSLRSYAPGVLPTTEPTGTDRKPPAAPGLRWGIGASRLCPRAASIPQPSSRLRAAKPRRPAQGGRVALGLALCRRLVAPWGRALFAHCGPLGPLARRLPGAERVGRASALWSVPWVPRPPGHWAVGPRPPPGAALGSVAGGPPPGPWGSRSGWSLLPLRSVPWAVWLRCSPGVFARATPSGSPRCGGCAAADLFQGDVAIATLRECGKTGQGCPPGTSQRQADAKTSPGSVPLNGLVPCPASFAVCLGGSVRFIGQ